MSLRIIAVFIILTVVNACAVVRTPSIVRVAVLAPFEGRYREVGYNALYAARLAFADASNPQVELLAVDDGGTEAPNRAAALTEDPLVLAALVLGYDATTPETLRAFDAIPTLIVGDWGAQPITDRIFILSNPQIEQQITAPPRETVTDAAQLPAPVTGGDVFALTGFAKLHESLEGVTVLSSGSLPTADFTTRYKGSDPFAPEPGLLAALTYDATIIAIHAAQTGSRGGAVASIASSEYDGINGTIRFQDGYWLDAPIHSYHYVSGVLTEDIVK